MDDAKAFLFVCSYLQWGFSLLYRVLAQMNDITFWITDIAHS